MKEIDARGLLCPKPVILVKKSLDEGENAILVRVDNAAAVENVRRLANTQGCELTVEGSGRDFQLTLTRNGAEIPAAEVKKDLAAPEKAGDWAAFVSRDIIGSGDRTLGGNLMRMYFYTLTQEEDEALPAAVIFMNDGVRLPTQDEQVAAHLKELIGRGVRVLVCGTCLDFYGLMDELRVGTVSNMYEIVTEMGKYGKVVTL